jgi:hypothetical protein
MSISYALVAREQVRLAEFSLSPTLNVKQVTSILSQLDPKSPRFSAEQGSQMFSTFTDSDRITFLCCSDRSVDSMTRGSFLTELQREWRLKFGSSGSSFQFLQKNQEFGPIIERLLKSYADPERSRGLREIRANIEETQLQMSQNLEQALTRNTRLEQMQDQADGVADAAGTYHREATAIRRRMCWQRYRTAAIVAIVVVVVIAVLVLGYRVRSGGHGNEDDP